MRDIYQAIVRASYDGKGLRLTADEVAVLAGDEGVFQAARGGWAAGRDWHEVDASGRCCHCMHYPGINANEACFERARTLAWPEWMKGAYGRRRVKTV